ncbi:uncharacterized protein KD926_010372 [Aspergillus affinis]|uniref:uncharacterized protein n=1 Tax=Aspergillus affinis TaxID=1070780 RepID=UPI0022FF29DC|nr:uncharacterized protein KD926_010372 [Aspergillus affinis]KAI9045049.1 hypothetical protein KD926_010372 [Aspergillus affinis]
MRGSLRPNESSQRHKNRLTTLSKTAAGGLIAYLQAEFGDYRGYPRQPGLVSAPHRFNSFMTTAAIKDLLAAAERAPEKVTEHTIHVAEDVANETRSIEDWGGARTELGVRTAATTLIPMTSPCT